MSPAIAIRVCDDGQHGARCRHFSRRWWWLRTIRCACPCHAAPEPRAQVEAVLDVLAPRVDLPPGLGLESQRVPVIYIDYDSQPVRPDDAALRALAEQIVTAIRTASGDGGTRR